MKLQPSSIRDIAALQKICTAAYTQIFADHWTGDGLARYLEHEFGTKRLQAELAEEAYEYFFIQKNNENIGFLKINYQSAKDLSELDNCELEKIYLLPQYSGQGIGKMAMHQTIQRVRRKGKKLFFLCVIDSNDSAIHFYQKLGFEFHSKTRLNAPLFKEALRGMHRMALTLAEEK